MKEKVIGWSVMETVLKEILIIKSVDSINRDE